jgi:hypothetical protein
MASTHTDRSSKAKAGRSLLWVPVVYSQEDLGEQGASVRNNYVRGRANSQWRACMTTRGTRVELERRARELLDNGDRFIADRIVDTLQRGEPGSRNVPISRARLDVRENPR